MEPRSDDGAATHGPSGEQLQLARLEDFNYLALAACMAVSNLWFLVSVLRFT